MRTAGQLNAGIQQSSEVAKGHSIFRVVEKANVESDLRKHERRIEFVLPEEGRDREKRPHSDISACAGRHIRYSMPSYAHCDCAQLVILKSHSGVVCMSACE